jgi:hypothetical protein
VQDGCMQRHGRRGDGCRMVACKNTARRKGMVEGTSLGKVESTEARDGRGQWSR